MTKPKYKPCPVCKQPNRSSSKTCSKCYTNFALKVKLKEKEGKYLKLDWGKRVLKCGNAMRVVDSARIAVSRLEAIGYHPILLMGRNSRPSKNVPFNWVAEVVTYLKVFEDSRKKVLLDTMTRAYEYVLKLQSDGDAYLPPIKVTPPDAAPPALPTAATSSQITTAAPSSWITSESHPVEEESWGQLCSVAESRDHLCSVAESMDQLCSVTESRDHLWSVAESRDHLCSSSAESAHPKTAPSSDLTREKNEEIHKAVVSFLVKGLHSVSTVECPWFRAMIAALNPAYRPPSRDELSTTRLPSWFSAEKHKVQQELSVVQKAAVTCDGWSSVSGELYVTLNVHYVFQGRLTHKALGTRAVYRSQPAGVYEKLRGLGSSSSCLVSEEMLSILQEYQMEDKVVAVTLDNSSNMEDVHLKKKLKFLKLCCFAQTLNLAGAKVASGSGVVAKWCAAVRVLVAWLKTCGAAKAVFTEKQQALNLPEQDLVVEVSGHWDSLYLMVERFVEQYPAIQHASLDRRLRRPMEEAGLEMPSEDDFHKAEEFLRVMKLLYSLTVAMSSEKSPTCGQILPILKKLELHFTVAEKDSRFTSAVKGKVWADLKKHYQDKDIQSFLQEATLMDPRFKRTVCGAEAEAAWDRLEKAAVAEASLDSEQLELPVEQDPPLDLNGSEESDGWAGEYVKYVKGEYSSSKRLKKSAVEELFEDEDEELLRTTSTARTTDLSVVQRVHKEMEIYRGLPAVPSGLDPVAWWWLKRDSLPILSALSSAYLCVQASSTPSERLFTPAGYQISQERSRLSPENANMVIFLQKNG